jgi:hypothetical protein
LGFTPLAKGFSFKALKTALSLDHDEEVESLQVEYTGSFLVFNRACLLASACPTRAIPAFGPAI